MINFISTLLPKKSTEPETSIAVKGKPWDKILHSRALIDYEVFGNKVGALWLSKYKGISSKPTFVFGWDLDGVHVYDLQFQIESFYDDWVKGLRSVPKYERWVIRITGQSISKDRVIEVTDVLKSGRPEDVQLAVDEIARVQELSRKGLRVERRIQLFVYYQVDRDKQAGEVNDGLEMFIKDVSDTVTDLKGKISGEKAKKDAINYEHLFKQCYSQGFQEADNIVSGRFKWKATAMNADRLWEVSRSFFSGDAPGQCPYIVHCKINEKGLYLQEEFGSRNIPAVLVKDYSPDLDPHWIHIKRWDANKQSPTGEIGAYKEDYIGVLAAKSNDFGWVHEYHQLMAIHDIYECEKIKDNVETIIEITPSNSDVMSKDAAEYRRAALKKIESLSRTGDYDPKAVAGVPESEKVMNQVHSGEKTLRVAFVILVHSSSPNELDIDCRTIAANFSVGTLEREMTVAYLVWLQTLPFTIDPLLVLKYKLLDGISISTDHRYDYFSVEAMGFLPLVTTTPADKKGLEFISLDRIPFKVDLFSFSRQPHWCAVAKQRGGKSNVGTHITNIALSKGQPVSWIDIPPEDDSSSLRDLCYFHDGNHIDMQRESTNLLMIPRTMLLGDLKPEVRQDRFKSLQSFWLRSLMILGGPPKSEIHQTQITEELLKTAIDLYLEDYEIQERYVEALKAGFSKEKDHPWQKQPTLTDFVEFIKPERIQHKLVQIRAQGAESIRAALTSLQIRLSRKADPNTVIGAALSRPSTVNIESSLLNVFSLRNLNPGSEESLAYILAAYTNAMQASLNHDISHVDIEEAQSMTKYEGILDIMQDIAQRGGKAGVRLGLQANSFEGIVKSSAGAALIDNLQVKFIGPIETGTIPSISENLKIPEVLVKKCATDSFAVNKKLGRSSWLVKIDSKHYYGHMYTPWISAALNSSNSNERRTRADFFETIKDKHMAIAAYTFYFKKCLTNGQEVVQLSQEKILEYLELCQKKMVA